MPGGAYRDQGLAHLQSIDQFMHDVGPLGQFDHDRQSGRSREHLQQFARGLIRLGRHRHPPI